MEASVTNRHQYQLHHRTRPHAEFRLSSSIGRRAKFVENHTSIAFKLKSYSVASAAGGLDVAHWNSITDTGDANSGGSFDATGIWSKQSSLNTQLAESTTTAGGRIRRRNRDAKSRQRLVPHAVSGSTSNFRARRRLDRHGGRFLRRQHHRSQRPEWRRRINAADWTIFLANTNKSFTGQSPVAAYLGGGQNGDLVNDFRDFRLFQRDFIAVNGQAAFAALSGANIPEPSTLVLAAMGLAGLALCRGYRKTLLLFSGAICAVSIFFVNVATASTATSFVAWQTLT